MRKLLTRNRKLVSECLDTAYKLRNFSPATYGAYQVTKPALDQYARGILLDIGCGNMPFRSLIIPVAKQYDTLDIEERTSGVTYVGDIQNMIMIPDKKYDSAVCFEVLEHVANPFTAVKEINRILKTNGYLIFSVPHLSRIHEKPNDYYRYTKYGIKHLFEQAGFELIQLDTRGGLFSFLGHQFSSFFVCAFWKVPVLKEVIFFLNAVLFSRTCFFIDNLIGSELMPLGYTGVVKKIRSL